ncbi:CheR family methyltransferase [Paenibacillus endoradicis]|uniref:CheR family methyltransferase n=1 Tax=Paenibacillus endoradicis TaxID=2972487 RepID=UPI002158DBB7|nr:protein-glutamate O-methyltransferase CheR [Paenibacillus endoradicis]MCR8659669.1 protein-glutamate O-methyltransferase CheR [Paenibacillus endoradicis]
MTLNISEQEFQQLAQYIHSHYGIHLKDEKKTLLVGRLQQVLYKLGMKSFSDYYYYLVTDRTGNAAKSLINHISTNHTFYMREADHFFFLRDHCLPQISPQQCNRDVRIWCAGCSSGEEAYTLAMILEDFYGAQTPNWDKKLLATDISTQALEKAVTGIYSSDAIESLPPLWRSKYLSKLPDQQYEMLPLIKEEILFRRFNLMAPSLPFKKKFHAIFCRNVMIYFDNPTKDRLIQQFYEATEPGGYLFLGHSESIDRNLFGFKYVQPSIYRKV